MVDSTGRLGDSVEVCRRNSVQQATVLPARVAASGLTHPKNVRFASESDLYLGMIMWFERESPIIATNDEVKSTVSWEARGEVSQPLHASLSFGGRTFNFEATHNAAAAGISLGIAWMHGTMQEAGGPTPVKSWSTMEVIKSRGTPRD